MENRQHPGVGACARIKRADGSASREDYVNALMYLLDRVEELERTVAARNRAFVPPEPQEVTDYARTIDFVLDGHVFCDHYSARNWCIGKTKMKCWKAAVRTWKNRRTQEQGQQRPARTPDNLRKDHGL
jgi:hypothetical protein